MRLFKQIPNNLTNAAAASLSLLAKYAYAQANEPTDIPEDNTGKKIALGAIAGALVAACCVWAICKCVKNSTPVVEDDEKTRILNIGRMRDQDRRAGLGV